MGAVAARADDVDDRRALGVTGMTCSRIASAKPAISSAVSPFVRNATRKPAICACVPSPSMIEPISSRASSRERWWPSRSSWIAGPMIIRGSSSPSPARAGQHALGVELDTLDRQLGVAHAHHLAVGGVRGDAERGGNLGRRKRVVAPHLDVGRQALVDPLAVVRDRARLAVQQRLRLADGAAERLDDRLVAKADAERRDRRAERLDQVDRDARALGAAGAGGDDEPVEAAGDASSTVIASFRTVTTSTPSSSNRCTRL